MWFNLGCHQANIAMPVLHHSMFASMCCDASGDVWTTRQLPSLCPADVPKILNVDQFILCSTKTDTASMHSGRQPAVHTESSKAAEARQRASQISASQACSDKQNNGFADADALGCEVSAAELQMHVIVSSSHMAPTMSVRCRGQNLPAVATAAAESVAEDYADGCHNLQVGGATGRTRTGWWSWRELNFIRHGCDCNT